MNNFHNFRRDVRREIDFSSYNDHLENSMKVLITKYFVMYIYTLWQNDNQVNAEFILGEISPSSIFFSFDFSKFEFFFEIIWLYFCSITTFFLFHYQREFHYGYSNCLFFWIFLFLLLEFFYYSKAPSVNEFEKLEFFKLIILQ